MAELDPLKNCDQNLESTPATKKKKLNKLYDSTMIHSSLSYCSLRAPPLLEYKTIESYCGSKLGKSLLPSNDKSNPPSTSGLNDLKSISSPLVFKTPIPRSAKRAVSIIESMPYAFFSVEELCLVKSLKHWINTKVCAVGLAVYNSSKQQCYLQSIMETGQWRLLLNTTSLHEIPDVHKSLQIFGNLQIVDAITIIKVNFYRYIESVNLPLFVESCKLMQKYVPDFVNIADKEEVINLSGPKIERAETELNDTLDDYNFPIDM